MAECNLVETSGDTGPKGTGSVVMKYQLATDTVILNPIDALSIGRGLGVPLYGAQLTDTFWFAQNFRMTRNEKNRLYWFIDVTFSPPPDGENEDQVSQTNPLERPAVYDIQYIESEYVIEKARNVENFPGGFGRAPGTLGPIVNTAYRRPDEPKVDTERNAVIVIERNEPSLGAIMELNETYQRTTNSDTVNIGGQSIGPRRLKYLGTFSRGRQEENGIVYYPTETQIEIKRTTDLILDNVGYEFWNTLFQRYDRATTDEGDYVADPVNLDINGEYLPGDTPIQITYRHLEEVPYADFFS